jgi:hypothetical protein
MSYCLNTKIAEMIMEYAEKNPLTNDAKAFIFALVERVGQIVSLHDAGMVAVRMHNKGFDLETIAQILPEVPKEDIADMLNSNVIH